MKTTMSCKFTATGKGFPAQTIFEPIDTGDERTSQELRGVLDAAGCTEKLQDSVARALCAGDASCDMYAHNKSSTCFYSTDDYRKFADEHNFVSGEGDSYVLDCSDVVAAFDSAIAEGGDVVKIQKKQVGDVLCKSPLGKGYGSYPDCIKKAEDQPARSSVDLTSKVCVTQGKGVAYSELEAMADALSTCERGAGKYKCDKDVYVPQHRDEGVFMCDEVHHADGVDKSVGLSSRLLNVSQEECYDACDTVRENGGSCPGIAYWRTGKRATMNTMQFYADMHADGVQLMRTETCREWLPPFLGEPGVCLDGYMPNTKVRSVVVDTGGLVREYGSTLYHKIHLQRALQAGGLQGVCTLSEYTEIIDGVKNTDPQYKMHGCAMMLAKVFDNNNPTDKGKVISERIVEDAVTSQKSRWRYIGEGFCRTKKGNQIVTSDQTAGSNFEISEPGSKYNVGDRLRLTTEQTCSGSAGECDPAIVQVTSVDSNGKIRDFDVEVKGEGYLQEPTAKPNGYDVAEVLSGGGTGAMFKVRTMSMPTCQKACGEDANCMAMSYDEWTSFRLKNPTWNQKVQTKLEAAKCADEGTPCYAGYAKQGGSNVCVGREKWSLGLDSAQCAAMKTLLDRDDLPDVERGAYGDIKCKVGNMEVALDEEKCIEFQDAVGAKVHRFPAYDDVLGCQVEWCPKAHLPKELPSKQSVTGGFQVSPSTGQCLSPYPNDSSCTTGGYSLQDKVFVQTKNPECTAINRQVAKNDRGQTRQERCELARGCVWDGSSCSNGRVDFIVRSVGPGGEIANVVTPDMVLANNMLRSGATYPIRAEQCFNSSAADANVDSSRTTKEECGVKIWRGGHGAQLQPTENVNCMLYGGDERYTQVDTAGAAFAAYDFTPYANGKCKGVDFGDTERYRVRNPDTGNLVIENLDPLLCLQKCQLTDGCNAVNFLENEEGDNGRCVMLGKCDIKAEVSGNWKYSKMTSNNIVTEDGELKVLGAGKPMLFPRIELHDPRSCSGCSSTTIGKWLKFYEERVPSCNVLESENVEGNKVKVHQLTCEDDGNNVCGIGSEYVGPYTTNNATPECRTALEAYRRGQKLDDAGNVVQWAVCPVRIGGYESQDVNTEPKCATRCREDPTCEYFTFTPSSNSCQMHTREQCSRMYFHQKPVNVVSVTRQKQFPHEKTLNILTSTGRACWSKERESKYLNSLLITPEWRGDDPTDKSTCVLMGERNIFTKVLTKKNVTKNGVPTCTINGKPCWAGFYNGCYAPNANGTCPAIPIPPKHRDDIMEAIYGTKENGYEGLLEGENEVLSRTQCTNVCSTDRAYACVDSFGAADPTIQTKEACAETGRHTWTNLSTSCSYGKTELAPYALVNPVEGLPVESLVLSDMKGKMHHVGGEDYPVDECDDPLVAGTIQSCKRDYDLSKMGPMKHGFTIDDLDASVKVTGYSEGQSMDCTVNASLSAEKQREECGLLGGTCDWVTDESGSACRSTVYKPSNGNAKVLCSLRLDDHTFLFQTEKLKNQQNADLPMPTNHVFDIELMADGERNVQDLSSGARCRTAVECQSGRCDLTGSYGCYGRCLADEARTTKMPAENCPFQPPTEIAEAQCEDKLRFIASRVRPKQYAEGFTKYQRQRPKKQPVGALCEEPAHCTSLTCGGATDKCTGEGNYTGYGKRCVNPNDDSCPFALGTRCTNNTDCTAGLYCATKGECHGRCTTSGTDTHCPSDLRPLTSEDMSQTVGLDEHGCGPFTDTIEDAVRVCGGSAPRDTARCKAMMDMASCSAPCTWDGGACRADPRIKKCNAFMRYENRHASGNNKTCYYMHTGPQLQVRQSLESWEIRDPGQVGPGASGDTFVQQITQPFVQSTSAADVFAAAVRPYEWEPLQNTPEELNTATCADEKGIFGSNKLVDMRDEFNNKIEDGYLACNASNIQIGAPKLTRRVLEDAGQYPTCNDAIGCCPNDSEYVRYGGDPFGSVCTNINTLQQCQIGGNEQNIPRVPRDMWKALCNLTRGYRSQGTWSFVRNDDSYTFDSNTHRVNKHVWVGDNKYRITKVDGRNSGSGVVTDVKLVRSKLSTGVVSRDDTNVFVHPTSTKNSGVEDEQLTFATTLVADLKKEQGKHLLKLFQTAGVPFRTSYDVDFMNPDTNVIRGGCINTGKYVIMEYARGFLDMDNEQQVALLRVCTTDMLPVCPTGDEPSEQLHRVDPAIKQEGGGISGGTTAGISLLVALGLAGLIYARTKQKINTSVILGYIVVSLGASFLYLSS